MYTNIQGYFSKKTVAVFFTLFLMLALGAGQASAQNINNSTEFPDAQFRAAAEQFLGVLPGASFTAADCAAKTSLFDFSDLGISEVKGLQYFTNITQLDASDNSITEFKTTTGTDYLGPLTKLWSIDVSGNLLTALELSASQNVIKDLKLANNSLTAITFVAAHATIEYLDITGNNFNSVDLSLLTNLHDFLAADNNLTTISLTNNTALRTLDIAGNQISALDLKTNWPQLWEVKAGRNLFVQIGTDIGGETDCLQLDNTVIHLYCDGDSASTPKKNDLSTGGGNRLYLDHMTELKLLDASDCGLTDLYTARDVLVNNTKLVTLILQDNAIHSTSGTYALSYANKADLAVLDVSGNTTFNATDVSISSTNNPDMRELDISRINITTDELSACQGSVRAILSTTDSTMLNNLESLKVNDTIGPITILGCTFFTSLTYLDCSENNIAAETVYGASYMTALTYWDMSKNRNLTDKTTFHLTTLDNASTGVLETVNVSECGIKYPNFNGTNRTTLQPNSFAFSDPTSLTSLIIKNNPITLLDNVTDNDWFLHTSINIPDPTLLVVDMRGSALPITATDTTRLYDRIGRPIYDSFGQVSSGYAVIPATNQNIYGWWGEDLSNWPPAEGVKLIYPNGGEDFEVANNTLADVTFVFATDKSALCKFYFSSDAGATYTELTALATTPLTLNVPIVTNVNVSTGGSTSGRAWQNIQDIDSSQCLIKITRADDETTYFDVSDYYFKIGRGGTQFVSTTRKFSAETDDPLGLFMKPQGEMEFKIKLSDTQNVESYKVQLKYDNTKLYYVSGSATHANTAAKNFQDPVVNNNSSAGLLTIVGVGHTKIAANQATTLLKVKFRTFPTVPNGTKTKIEFINVNTSINDGAIDFYGVPAEIYVGQRFMWGDLNNDNIPGTLDAAELMQFNALLIDHFTGYPDTLSPSFPEAADLNGDGKAGTLDATLLLQYAAGIINKFEDVDDDEDGYGPDPLIPAMAASRNIASQPRKLAASVASGANSWTLNLSVDDADDISGVRMVLRYDPSVLKAAVDSACWMESPSDAVVANAQDGVLIIVGALMKPLDEGESGLVSVNFEPVAGADQPLIVEVDKALSQINDGQIAIDGASLTSIDLVTGEAKATTDVDNWMFY
ncbi:MAG: hypothetical protein AB1656_24535 [Candidatus Omnitrophota bacterium]